MDETSLVAEARKIRVVVPKDMKLAPSRDLPHFSHHMTLVMCICADGTAMKMPTVILPLQTLPALSDIVMRSYHFAGSETGWINVPIWSSWIVTTFIPEVNEKRAALLRAGKKFSFPQFDRVILYLDSHASRLDEFAHRELEKHGIVCVSIPAHSSHILQPLDNGINNHLKHAIRHLAFLKFINLDEGVVEYRNSLLFCVKAALDEAYNFLRVLSSFARCGLWPFNPDLIINDPAKVTPSMVVPVPPEKPTIVQQISGTVVRAEVIHEHRLKKEEEERKKEKEKKEKELAKNARAEAAEAKKKAQLEKTEAREAVKALKEAGQALKAPLKRKTPSKPKGPRVSQRKRRRE